MCVLAPCVHLRRIAVVHQGLCGCACAIGYAGTGTIYGICYSGNGQPHITSKHITALLIGETHFIEHLKLSETFHRAQRLQRKGLVYRIRNSVLVV